MIQPQLHLILINPLAEGLWTKLKHRERCPGCTTVQYIPAVDAEIFVPTIFRGLNFRVEKIFVGEGSPQNLNYHKNFTPKTLTHETKWCMKI